MHITFLTLFLGLASGWTPVELAVTGAAPGAPPITALEFQLDGKPAGGLTGPPFQGEVDLGPDLLPHHLVALGLDATGIEVARAEQWINLPQPAAAVDLAPETEAGGRLAAIRLSFQSRTLDSPIAVTATLDGAALPVRQQRVTLPAYRPEQPHLLSVEARFPQGVARRDFAFGGGLETEVATDLTAVLVRTPAPLPPLPALAGWFAALGQPLTATAIEEAGTAEILVVRDRAATVAVQSVGQRAFHAGTLIPVGYRWRTEMPLPKRTVVRFVESSANAYSRAGTTSLLFDSSVEFDGRNRGFFALVSRVPPKEIAPPHLADAVAVAGLDALATNRRRAVVLLLYGTTADPSRFETAAVRRYMDTIRVPLHVWSLLPPPYPPEVSAWGQVEDASSLAQMREAYKRLTRDLASQRLLWLDGRHLPQSIALTPAAPKNVELVAGPLR